MAPTQSQLLLLLLLLLPAVAVSDVCKTCKCTSTASDAVVDCSQRNLAQLPPDIPANTTLLRLNNNHITSIGNGSLQQLSLLRELYFTDNQLSAIRAGELAGLKRLQKLYLARNRLTDFPDLCSDTAALTHLGLDQNQLKNAALPPSYKQCSSLLSLVLTKNIFEELGNDTLAAAPPSLQSLKMNSVRMASIRPASLLGLAGSLKTLDLSDNPFDGAALAKAFAETSFSNKFVGLTLKKSALTSVGAELLPHGHFPRLDIVHFGGSAHLADIAPNAFDGVPSVTRLFLNDCPLTTIGQQQLAPLKQLVQLNLAGSKVTGWQADAFDQLRQLQMLDLSNTEIQVIGGVNGSENSLRSLLSNATSLQAGGLRIGNTQLVCNCSLLWLTQQLALPRVRRLVYKVDEVMCDGGQRKLVDCRPTNCHNDTTTTTTTSTSTSTSTFTSTSTSASTTAQPTTTTQQQQGGMQPLTLLLIGISCGLGLLVLLLAVALVVSRRRRRHGEGGGGQSRLLGDGFCSGGECLRLNDCWRRTQSDRLVESDEEVN